MRILRIEIEEFGKLAELDLTLHEGLNLIEGKIESGKSTLLAFLRFVLYGFPRRSGANAAERDKRLSWRTKRAAGTLTVETADGIFRIRREVFLRGSAARESASESLSVTRADTNERVALDGKTPGELFLGLPAELYDSSLYLAQSDAERVADPAVREALGETLFSSGATLCAEDAEKRLDTARRQLKHNRGVGGLIARLTAEQSRLTGEIRQAAEDTDRLAEIRESIYRCRTKIEDCRTGSQALEGALEHAELCETAELFKQRNALQAELAERTNDTERAKAALDALPSRDAATRLAVALHELEAARTELARSVPEPDIPAPDSALLERAALIERMGGENALAEQANKLQKSAKNHTVGACIAFLLTALSVALGILLLPLLTLGGALLIAAVILLLSARARKKALGELLAALQIEDLSSLHDSIAACESARRDQEEYATRLAAQRAARQHAEQRELTARARLAEALTPFGSVDPERLLDDASNRLTEIDQKREAAQAELNAATLAQERTKTRAEAISARLQGLDEASVHARLAELPALDRPVEQIKTQKTELAQTHTALTAQLTDLERAEAALCATSHDPHALAREHAAVSKELHDANARLAAIELAMTVMQEASEELRRSITPRLRADAATTFAALTARDEQALLLGQDFSLSISVDGVPQPLSRFSAGCRDAAHLSLRLALLATLSQEKLPLFFDEAFARLDDDRTKALLDILCAYCATGAQVLLFTCHSRERELLAGHDLARFTL